MEEVKNNVENPVTGEDTSAAKTADSKKKTVKYPNYAFPIDDQLPDSNPELYKALTIDNLFQDAYCIKDNIALEWLNLVNEDKDKNKSGKTKIFNLTRIKKEYFAKFKHYVHVAEPRPVVLSTYAKYRNQFINELGKSNADMISAAEEAKKIIAEEKKEIKEARDAAEEKKKAKEAKKTEKAAEENK